MSSIKSRIRFTNLNVSMYRCLGEDIKLHDVIHGFWDGRGVGTNYIEAKLILHLMDMRKDVLYDIFMDPPKEFDASYRNSCIEKF